MGKLSPTCVKRKPLLSSRKGVHHHHKGSLGPVPICCGPPSGPRLNSQGQEYRCPAHSEPSALILCLP